MISTCPTHARFTDTSQQLFGVAFNVFRFSDSLAGITKRPHGVRGDLAYGRGGSDFPRLPQAASVAG
jgi:hypothetical protein